MRWELLNKNKIMESNLTEILLKNRGLKTKNDMAEFLSPKDPMGIKLEEIGIDKKKINKVITRIIKAKENKEFVIVYGDYDADGITATAILWETLHDFGLNILPFIPDRFEDGYGIKAETVKKLKEKFADLSLIITVDNGIVAYSGIEEANKLKIDTVVLDHHQKGKEKLLTDYVLHTTEVCGSTLAWFFSKEISDGEEVNKRLELAAIGTIADQLPLIGTNRSVVKFGLQKLAETKRPGLLALIKESGIKEIRPYEIGFVIAPRINSMGRLKNGLESLRLLCTKDKIKAIRIADTIGKVNKERQDIVDKVVASALKKAAGSVPNIIVLSDEGYHEGVIGLAAARLVEKFYRPSIVISVKGENSKASARSVAGFNIIEAIREVNLHIEGGGHPMAAGFSIKTENIDVFTKKINEISKELLNDEILQKKIRIDCEMGFDLINNQIVKEIEAFEPTGVGNPRPVFLSKEVEVVDARLIGKDKKHLKIKLKKSEQIFDSVYFGGGENYSDLKPGQNIDVVYHLEENIWNGMRSIQLQIKDITLL